MSSSISSQIIEKKISDWKWHKIFRFTSYLIKNIKFQDGAGFWYNRCSAGNLNGAVYKGGYYQLKTISITNERGEQHSMMRNNHDDGLIWTTLHNKVWNSLYSNKTLLKFLISSNKNFLMLIVTRYFQGKDYSFMMAELRVRPRNFRPIQRDASKSSKTLRNGGQPDKNKAGF